MGPRINGVINGVINGMINGVRVKFRSIKLEFKAQSKRFFTLTPFIYVNLENINYVNWLA